MKNLNNITMKQSILINQIIKNMETKAKADKTASVLENTELINNAKTDFAMKKELLHQLTNDEYTQHNPELSNATIGEHMRHIIELFGCLIENYENGIINYDKRKRDILIQTNKNNAISILEKYLDEINKPNKSLSLVHNCYSTFELLPTNYFRELIIKNNNI